MDTRTYKRCEFIIRRFMTVGKPTPELAAAFHLWLLNGRNCREKNLIVRKLFEGMFFEGKTLSKPQNKNAIKRSLKKRIS